MIPIQAGSDVFVNELTDGPMVEVVVGADAGLDDGLKLTKGSALLSTRFKSTLAGAHVSRQCPSSDGDCTHFIQRFCSETGSRCGYQKVQRFQPTAFTRIRGIFAIDDR